MLNILLPIIVNALLVSVVLAELFVSRKQGWRLALAKLILLVGAGVGSWFLAPTLVTELNKIEFIKNLNLVNINLVIFSILTLVEFLIIALVCGIISRAKRYEKNESVNTAKVKRAKSLDRKLEKQLRKEEKKARKLERKIKELKKGSKVAGLILGIITGLIVSVLVFIPLKSSFNSLKEITNQEYFESAYEYTAYEKIGRLIVKEK